MDPQTRRPPRTAPQRPRTPYRSSEAPYRPLGPRYRPSGPRPDRVAAWAIALGVLMILLASATSRADTTGGAAVPAGTTVAEQPLTGGAGQPADRMPSGGELEAKVARTPTQVATWYGPGFFGRRTACGQILRRSTKGVAHRRLPCGTPVTVYYRGRLVTTRVIDRGPYSERASWDLTQATARELGIRRTSRVHILH